MAGVSPVEVLNIGDGLAFRQSTVLAQQQLSPRVYWNKIQALAPVTVFLPPAASMLGQVMLITNLTNFQVTIDGDGVETINGALILLLGGQFRTVELISDGTQWIIKAQGP